MLKLNFKECITDTFPQLPTRDLLQVYKSENGDKINDQNFIPHGYLRLAELIVEKMYADLLNHKNDIFYDYYALPILNLYINAIEFTLKLLKEKLEEHRNKKSCNQIRDNNSLLRNDHNLGSLLEYIESILPDNGFLHVLENFKEIVDFIAQIEKYGITSTSTRYLTKISKELHSLFEKDTYINFRKLNQNISSICNIILDYINGEHFLLCSSGEFTRERLDELKLSQKLLEKNRDIFMREIMRYSQKKNDSIDDVHMDLKAALEELESQGRVFSPRFDNFTDSEIAAMKMGLYFSNGADVVRRLDSFILSGRENNIRKIQERFLQYEKSFNNLNQHISYVEKIIEENNRSKSQ